jgi:hypothetical protein
MACVNTKGMYLLGRNAIRRTEIDSVSGAPAWNGPTSSMWTRSWQEATITGPAAVVAWEQQGPELPYLQLQTEKVAACCSSFNFLS